MSTPEEFYRVLVQKYIKSGELSLEDYEALETDRAHLGLRPATARAIEQELLHSAPPASVAPPVATVIEPVIEPVVKTPDPAKPVSPPQVPLPIEYPSADITLEPFSPAIGSDYRSFSPDKAFAKKPKQHSDKNSADFIAHRQQYKQELLQALKEEGFLLSKETNARLNKLEEQFQLDKDDVTEILQEVMKEITTNPSRPPQPPGFQSISPDETPTAQSTTQPAEAATVPPLKATIYDGKFGSRLELLKQTLESPLASRDFKAADRITYEILMQMIDPDLGWFDEDSLRNFLPQLDDKQTIQEIDRLWSEHSQSCGFGQQMLLFGELPQVGLDARRDEKSRLRTLEFSRSAQWWIEALGFYKFYDQLDFSAQAPQGHLPALWFWQIPRRKAFDYGNLGILAQRGGCRLEEFTLSAFMAMLKRCGIEPGQSVKTKTKNE